MAKHSAHILELAKKGAMHRYEELKAELASLTKAFPHLRFGSAVSPMIDLSSDLPATIDRKPRKRRRMSAAARRQISQAQKARWAALRAKKSDGKSSAGGRKRSRMSTAARKAVSERMKKYWAQRRKTEGKQK